MAACVQRDACKAESGTANKILFCGGWPEGCASGCGSCARHSFAAGDVAGVDVKFGAGVRKGVCAARGSGSGALFFERKTASRHDRHYGPPRHRKIVDPENCVRNGGSERNEFYLHAQKRDRGEEHAARAISTAAIPPITGMFILAENDYIFQPVPAAPAKNVHRKAFLFSSTSTRW